jgi:hypothetical protein
MLVLTNTPNIQKWLKYIRTTLFPNVQLRIIQYVTKALIIMKVRQYIFFFVVAIMGT